MLVIMGRPVIDVQLNVPTIPAAGEKVLASGVVAVAGGVDGNFASSFSSLGAHVTAIGSAGDDEYAQVDNESLLSFGVDVRWDAESAGPSTVCYVAVDDSGNRTVIVDYPDDGERVTLGLDRGVSHVVNERWDLVYVGVLRVAHRSFLKEVSQATNLVAATLEHSDWSESWIRSAAAELDIVFVAQETYEAHEGTLLELQEKHRWTLVVTEGAAGSRLIAPSGSSSAAVCRVDGAIQDTTGAGDAFASAFCAAWLLGDRNLIPLQLANWYAASKIRLRGPRAFPPPGDFLAERDRLLAERIAY